jgi:energy-coupling factor transport system ATP-binding protein
MYKLEVKGVTHVYGAKTPFEKTALHDVSVGFEAGKITGLIGHTGSGKSTLVQMLNGLLRPLSGEILLDGEDIWSRPKEIGRVRTRVGLVMQYPEYQLFDETVRRDIGFALRNAGLPETEIDERVTEASECVGLDAALLDKSPFDLSGGQKRRAAIAGVLAMRPEVLVLDEPAAGLDPRGRADILGYLRRYRERFGATVILVSHSMEDMAHYCDNVVVMRSGEIFLSGTVEEVFYRAEELASVGLDIPQVMKIALRLRSLGVPLSGKLYTVDGARDAILAALKGRGC